MYLMEGRKLLDAQVFNGRQKLLKLSLQTFFSVDFWEFYFSFQTFVLTWSYEAYVVRQLDRKKELEAMREERE